MIEVREEPEDVIGEGNVGRLGESVREARPETVAGAPVSDGPDPLKLLPSDPSDIRRDDEASLRPVSDLLGTEGGVGSLGPVGFDEVKEEPMSVNDVARETLVDGTGEKVGVFKEYVGWPETSSVVTKSDEYVQVPTTLDNVLDSIWRVTGSMSVKVLSFFWP